MVKKRQKDRKSISLRLPIDLTSQLVDRINAFESSVKTDYLKAEFLSKYVSPDTDPALVRRNRAIFKWLVNERENEATNDRLLITSREYNLLPRVPFGGFVDWCRDLVRDIIGDSPPVEALIGSFSGGASTSRNRTSSHPALKYTGKVHCTPEAFPWFQTVCEELPGWLGCKDLCNLKVVDVPGNVLFTVPKKTDIDRVACKEPDLNMFIQKGIGNYFRKCLRRTGINLNDQTKNRSLAHEGSVSGKLCTLDLSSASDSVTEGLVALLLPEIWFTLLDAVRCRVTSIDGEEHRNHMFSSMGNGFTFELESLLFYVLARATAFFTGTRGVVSVYGDDIICSTDMSQDLIWVLGYFGFTVNTEKSFWSGPFRESCGGHYWNGLDITPFYIREPIDSLDKLIDIANKLRQWATVEGLGTIWDPQVEETWLWLKGFVPRCLWGGVDTSFKFQLVSKDTPEMRLSEETTKSGTGLGGYFHWLNATWERADLRDGISTSSRTRATGKYRLKKARPSAVDRLGAEFYHEFGY